MKKLIIFGISFFFIFNHVPHNFVTYNKCNKGYTGYLIIPSVDMLYGFYSQDDFRNNINYNIEILSNSKEDSLFIAAHSGVGELAFFNDLELLTLNDDVFIKYNGKKYHYKVKEIFLEEKDGDIKITKGSNENVLVLTTCSQRYKGFQLVIKAILMV